MQDILKFLKDQKGKLLLLIIPVALLLIVIGSGEDTTTEPNQDGQLAELCSSVDGVGECRVMVTYRDGEVYAVAIICEGAENPKTRERLLDIITSIYGIGSNRVTIQRLNSS